MRDIITLNFDRVKWYEKCRCQSCRRVVVKGKVMINLAFIKDRLILSLCPACSIKKLIEKQAQVETTMNFLQRRIINNTHNSPHRSAIAKDEMKILRLTKARCIHLIKFIKGSFPGQILQETMDDSLRVGEKRYTF